MRLLARLSQVLSMLLVAKDCMIHTGDVDQPDVSIRGKCSWFRSKKNSAIQYYPQGHYVACRWNYERLGIYWNLKTTEEVKERLRHCLVVVRNPANNRWVYAMPSDWGPSAKTGRVIDCSFSVLAALDANTNDTLSFYLHQTKNVSEEEDEDKTHDTTGTAALRDECAIARERGGTTPEERERRRAAIRKLIRSIGTAWDHSPSRN